MIFIVTPVYNRKEFTRNYLKALAEQTVQDFKVIIIDDGSTDGTSDMIEKEFPEVILLKEEGDLWWAEATNIGVKYALAHDADYIMTLNDDTVPERDYIEKMVYWSNKKPSALLGALAIDVTSGEPVAGGWLHSWKTTKLENLISTLKPNEFKGLHKVDVFPGRGLLIPVKVFKNIGLYDSKSFPQAAADDDFTYRAANAKYEIFANCDAKIKIYPDASGGVFLRKNKSFVNYYKHLFSIKGSANLKYFTKLVIKNCPKRYMLKYLFVGWSRRLGGYLKEWFFEFFDYKYSKYK